MAGTPPLLPLSMTRHANKGDRVETNSSAHGVDGAADGVHRSVVVDAILVLQVLTEIRSTVNVSDFNVI